MATAERYRECIRALEKCTESVVCRFEFDIKQDGSSSIIVTASSREHEMEMAKLAVSILGGIYGPDAIGSPRNIDAEEE